MKLTVTLPNHHYDLWIEKGILTKVCDWVKKLWKQQKIAIITDETVDQLYGSKISEKLLCAGFEVSKFVFAAGETSKSLATAQEAYDFLADQGFTRTDGILALGGGVVGDLASFVASTYLRGIHFLQVPTTLLAQVDSSIGGKTAVNTKIAKNIVGTFSQPDGVLIDPKVLNTLEDRQVREGIAEIVKYAAIADISLWKKLNSYKDEFELLENVQEVIYACCEIKRKIVEEDEFDNGKRLILNFGHTIGHAIEAVAGFGVITHGEAVAMGMVQMSKVAEKKGLTKPGTMAALISMLEKFHLPTYFSSEQREDLYQAITHDKKARGEKIKIVLLSDIGKGRIVSVTINTMMDYLTAD
ncbi:MAG: 3-dehydroquinate synthase [Lactobacillales bacterium]|jgi:3-dehydroquinate synthase|nr:3-dehydroquinate synthase [Lactobacillales bacterium]